MTEKGVPNCKYYGVLGGEGYEKYAIYVYLLLLII